MCLSLDDRSHEGSPADGRVGSGAAAWGCASTAAWYGPQSRALSDGSRHVRVVRVRAQGPAEGTCGWAGARVGRVAPEGDAEVGTHGGGAAVRRSSTVSLLGKAVGSVSYYRLGSYDAEGQRGAGSRA